MKNKRTEQEKLVLNNYEWDLLVKKLSSIVNKVGKMESNNPHQTTHKAKQIKIKALECLEIVKYKNIKDGK